MIYKFKSQAAGDVIMLGPHGDQVLGLMGKSPAPQGIIEPGAMEAAIAALTAAVHADEAARVDAGSPTDAATPEPVSLRQRAWPLVEMLKQARAANEPIVWGA